MPRHATLLWTLVAFFAGTLLVVRIRREPE
jgi:hypothetical protein